MNCHLIAHRGEPARWPENALQGFIAALEAGACYVETDVQITADGVPVLCHDDSLLKLTGQDLRVTETLAAEVVGLPAGYPARFGERFADTKIATLEAFAELLAHWPSARAFVEIKLASIRAFGVRPAVDLMLNALAGVRAQVIPISFEYPALQYLGGECRLPTGWVLPAWNDENRRLAEALAPEYLFVNRKRIPGADEALWPGSWQWVVYTANCASEIEQLFAQGFDLVETDNIRQVTQDLEKGH